VQVKPETPAVTVPVRAVRQVTASPFENKKFLFSLIFVGVLIVGGVGYFVLLPFISPPVVKPPTISGPVPFLKEIEVKCVGATETEDGVIKITNKANQSIIPSSEGLTIEVDGLLYTEDSSTPIQPGATLTYSAESIKASSLKSGVRGVVYGNNIVVSNFTC